MSVGRKLRPTPSMVVAMLALLHIAVFRGVADPWARGLLLAHLGLVLLWQPFLRAEQRVSPLQGFILALVAFTLMLQLDWWLLAFWVVILAGLVGGKVYQQQARWQRRCYLLVLLYLLALLAIVIMPEVAPRREIVPEVRAAAEYALPLILVLIAVIPTEADAGAVGVSRRIDEPEQEVRLGFETVAWVVAGSVDDQGVGGGRLCRDRYAGDDADGDQRM